MNALRVRAQNTGFTLPAPPEFDDNDAWPSISTDWVALQWELFESAGQVPAACVACDLVQAQRIIAAQHPEIAAKSLITEDPLCDDFLYDAVFSHSSAAVAITRRSVSVEWQIRVAAGDKEDVIQTRKYQRRGRRLAVPDQPELRRVVYSTRWRRQDPVVQLPPGSTHEATHSISTGLTVERSLTLADSLGLGISGGGVGVQARLSSELTRKFGFSLEITAREETQRKLILSNQSDVRYRRFALWHIDHRITVSALEIPAQRELTRGLHAYWSPRADLEFAKPDEPFVTYVDLDRLRTRHVEPTAAVE